MKEEMNKNVSVDSKTLTQAAGLDQLDRRCLGVDLGAGDADDLT